MAPCEDGVCAIELSGENAYVYRTYSNNCSCGLLRRLLYRLCPCTRGCCLCCDAETDTPPSSARPDTALRLCADVPKTDGGWITMLLTPMHQRMRQEQLDRLYVFSRSNPSRELFHMNLAPERDAAGGGGNAMDDTHVVDLLQSESVRRALHLCLGNAQPTDGAVVTADGRRFLLQSVPLFTMDDQVAGALWRTRRVHAAGEGRLAAGRDDERVEAQRRAAIYYDDQTRTYVVNDAWLQQRRLLGDVLATGDGADVSTSARPGTPPVGTVMLDGMRRVIFHKMPAALSNFLLPAAQRPPDNDLPAPLPILVGDLLAGHIGALLDSVVRNKNHASLSSAIGGLRNDKAYILTATVVRRSGLSAIDAYVLTVEATNSFQKILSTCSSLVTTPAGSDGCAMSASAAYAAAAATISGRRSNSPPRRGA